MAVNFGQLKTRILNEARKDSATFGTAAGEAIVSAIQFYDYKPLWFNKKSTTLTLLSATQAVDLPSDFRSKIKLRLLNEDRWRAEREGFVEITTSSLWDSPASTTDTGMPNGYAFFGTQILFDIAADANYSLDLRYVYGDSAYPSVDASTSLWFGDYCVDCTRKKALEYFYRDALKDSAKGDEYEAAAARKWQNLITQDAMRSKARVS